MSDDRWPRVKPLFQAAVERPAAERDAFLAAAAGADEDLRREVESLLVSDEAETRYLDRVREAGEAVLADAATLAGGPAAAAQPPPVLGAPRRVGSFEVLGLLGSGGMGEVYRARDTKLNREVALKVLPPPLAFDPDRLARFRREAQVLAALSHPGIAAICGLEDSSGVQALALELVEGPTLADRIAAGPRALPEALAVASQVAEAVEAAHEKGIVHRDLKPANIKLAAGGAVKVLDFGLAKSAGPDGAHADVTGSHDGLILGTASYMSPEQARGRAVDKRSDIWAFGCVLYEILTGRQAFPGATVSDTIAKVLEREPDWSALPPETPAPVRRVLLRCLAKDPRQRMRDIGDVRVELDAADERPPGGPEATPPAAATRRHREWLPWVAVLALAVAFGVREAKRPAGAPEDPLAEARFTRFTDWEGTEAAAEISPNGRFVAFAADRDGEFDIWQSQVGTGEFHNLTREVGALEPGFYTFRKIGFSGDGANIWFSHQAGPSMAQMILPLMDGTPRAFLDKGRRELPGPPRRADGALRRPRGGPVGALAVGARRGAQAHPADEHGARAIHVGFGQPGRPAPVA